MASTSSRDATRVGRRRAAVVDEALTHAVAVMGEEGVGALTVNEVARRMGLRGPSLYKYFPSRHAIYDALFARGLACQLAAVASATGACAPGVERLRAGGTAVVRWAVENPALAQLLHWRPVPGFEPSPSSLDPGRDDMARLRAEFAQSVELGQLTADADSEVTVRLWTVVLSGLISQQLANQPGVGFDEGDFSRLTGSAIDLFLSAYTPTP